VHAFLIAPFWLAYAHKPVRAEERVQLFDDCLTRLQRAPSSKAIDWRVVKLEARQQIDGVRPPRIWHPREIVARKQRLLIGEFRNAEELPTGLGFETNDPAVSASISRRSIVYYDFGIGALEYDFLIESAGDPAAFGRLLADPQPWKQFADGVCDAVIARGFAAFQDACGFDAAMADLTDALAYGSREAFELSASFRRAPARWYREHLLPIHDLFGLNDADGHSRRGDAVRLGRLTENINMLFVIESDAGPDGEKLDLERVVPAILGGLPVGQDGKIQPIEDQVASSDYFDHVFHGAAYSLATIASGQRDPGAIAQSARNVFRYLALAYAAFTDASRGLAARQLELGFSQSETVAEVGKAERLSNILISEFQNTNFWDTDFEQDIYHRGFITWGMAEKVAALRENLNAVASAEQGIREHISARRQKHIATILAFFTALTIISAATDLFTFAGFYDREGNLRFNFAQVRVYLSLILLVLCGMLVGRVWTLHRDR
jgi:hypothetical protein